jgi:hypothetical protein
VNPEPSSLELGPGRRRWLLILLSVLLVSYIFMINPVFFLMEGGSAHYLVLARSIASGSGMSEIFLPEPFAHTKSPFMFPLMLAGIDLASSRYFGFGYNMVAVKILLFAFMVMAAVFIYLALRREARFWLAFAVVALSISSPLILSLMRRVLTEIPYLAMSFAALYFALKILADEGKKKDWILLSILFFAAYFTRTIAFTLILAFLLILFFRAIRKRESRREFAYGIAAILPTAFAALLWAIRGFRARGSAGLDYMSELLVKSHPYSVLMGAVDMEAPLRPDMEKTGLLDLMQRMWEQIKFFIRTISQTLDPWLQLEGPLGGHWLVIGIMVVLCVIGLIVLFQQRKTLIPLYFLSFLFVICIWPYRDPRFVLPVLPLFFYLIIAGGEKLVSLILLKTGSGAGPAKTIRWISAGALLLWIGISNLIVEAIILDSSRNPAYSVEYQISPVFKVRAETINRGILLSLLEWVREKTPDRAVIMFHSPRVVFLITGRKCVSVPITKDTEKFWKYADTNKVDYIIVDEFYRELGGGANLFTPEYLVPALNARKDRYMTVFRVPGSQSAVVRVVRL